ncbi:MAG: deoxyuridine 5'-triphosphate nucleotidohydrolase [Bacilli bacterium]|nr:deoxyuridine 5'-triphosphate nucleotidohydrolase [Bacilli bacterium]
MDRCFKKISYKQFKKDICSDKLIYDSYFLPKRSSKNSCGYDFSSIYDYTIKPGEILKIPTGCKFKCNSDEFLMLVVRSGMGFKYNVRMCNQVGIIDNDYYNNKENEGHIWICLQNEGESDFIINRGDKYCQGIVMKYLTCNDKVETVRIGGIGSTNREKE